VYRLCMMRDRRDQIDEHTSPQLRRKIAEKMECRVRGAAALDHAQAEERQQKLRGEWDAARVLQGKLGAIVVVGSLFGLTRSRLCFLVSLAAGVFLVQHALKGWTPPLALARRLGLRTPDEIARERVATAILSGDVATTTDPAQALSMAAKIF